MTVNGEAASMGMKIAPDSEVRVHGKPVKKEEEKVLLAMNKPAGIVCTAEKKEKNNIVDYMKYPKRIYPVGRLDKDSTGLLLLTNDGAFANALMHPKHEVEKTYDVWVTGYTPGGERRLAKPITLDGYTIRSPKVKLLKAEGQSAKFRVTIHEGRNRQVRKMVEQIGHQVVMLRRIRFGPLKLGELPRGMWRPLTHEELDALKKL